MQAMSRSATTRTADVFADTISRCLLHAFCWRTKTACLYSKYLLHSTFFHVIDCYDALNTLSKHCGGGVCQSFAEHARTAIMC